MKYTVRIGLHSSLIDFQASTYLPTGSDLCWGEGGGWMNRQKDGVLRGIKILFCGCGLKLSSLLRSIISTTVLKKLALALTQS